MLARFVRINPKSWNGGICLRFDVLTTPGKVQGRYVTVYSRGQLGVCEATVIPEIPTEVRSNLCHPRALEYLCLQPTVMLAVNDCK